MWLVYKKYWRVSDERGRYLWQRGGLDTELPDPRDMLIGDPEAGEPRRYDPLTRRDLLNEVAVLEEGDEDGLFRFIHRWGTLETRSFGRASILWNSVREVGAILELHDQMRRGNAKALGQILEVLGLKAGDDPVTTARLYIADRLNLVLWEVGQRFDDEALPDQLRLRPTVDTLNAAIYWHLAQAVADGRPVEYCLECSKPFVVTDARQRFHPPPKGQRYSRCYERWRKRRKRDEERLKRRQKNGG